MRYRPVTENPKPLLGVFACVVLLGVIGLLWWRAGPREFYGRIGVLDDKRMYIPEDPPGLVSLVTASGSYELAGFGFTRRSVDPKRLRELREMDGRQAVVRGRPGTRRSMSGREHRVLRVIELRLIPPGTTTAPGGTGLYEGAKPARAGGLRMILAAPHNSS